MPQTVVEIVNSDLSHEETILQITQSLDHLSLLTDQMFDSLQQKLSNSSSKIQSLNQRVQAAEKKIDLMRNNNKATCIYSSAKYPAQSYQPFRIALNVQVKRQPLQRTKTKNPQNVGALNALDIHEKLHFYHIKPKERRDGLQARVIPFKLKSAASLLIYDTDINPYRKIQDPNRQVRSKKVEIEDFEQDSGLGVAPASLTEEGDQVDDGDNYFYNPEMGDLPEFEMLPDVLDLPNVAQDLSYSTDLGPAIAPSVARLSKSNEDSAFVGTPSEDMFQIEPTIESPAAEAPFPPPTVNTIPDIPESVPAVMPITIPDIPESNISIPLPPPPPPPPTMTDVQPQLEAGKQSLNLNSFQNCQPNTIVFQI